MKAPHRFCIGGAALLLVAAGATAGEPQRIVSLAPNLTQMVLAAGAGDRLAAVTPFCPAPDDIPRITGGIQPESEVVLTLDPDLVLATPLTPSVTRDQLTRLGLRVETIEVATLADIARAQQRIAALLGCEAPAAGLPRPSASSRSAVLLFGADTGYSAGPGTHANEMLEAAGLRNIAATAGGAWPLLGEEFLLAGDPDIILIADYGETPQADALALLRQHPVRRHLSAVRSGRVVVIPASAFSIPGPGAFDAVKTLRAQLP